MIIFNSLGQIVAVPINSFSEAGVHKLNFNASRLPSGIYYYTLALSGKQETRSMILLK